MPGWYISCGVSRVAVWDFRKDMVMGSVSERRLWVCGCGCSTFELYDDGGHGCAACGMEWREGSWYEVVPVAGEYRGEPFRDVMGNGCLDFAWARVRRLCDGDDVAMVVVARSDGETSAWFGGDATPERRKWFGRRLKDARSMLKKVM